MDNKPPTLLDQFDSLRELCTENYREAVHLRQALNRAEAACLRLRQERDALRHSLRYWKRWCLVFMLIATAAVAMLMYAAHKANQPPTIVPPPDDKLFFQETTPSLKLPLRSARHVL
jgi:anti-sigma-K factor RskA